MMLENGDVFLRNIEVIEYVPKDGAMLSIVTEVVRRDIFEDESKEKNITC